MKAKKPVGRLAVGAMFAAALLFLATGLEQDHPTLLLCAALMVVCAILSMMQHWNRG